MEALLLGAPQAELNITYLHWLFRASKNPQDKVTYLIKKGDLIPLKRGLYALSSSYNKQISTKIIASMMYPPSYISLQSALKYDRLIPETTFGEVSVTLNRTKTFETPMGNFVYHNCSINEFHWGLRFAAIDQQRQIRIASPLKALYDLLRFGLAQHPRLSLDQALEYLDLLRIDCAEFKITSSELLGLERAHFKIFGSYLKHWLKIQRFEATDE